MHEQLATIFYLFFPNDFNLSTAGFCSFLLECPFPDELTSVARRWSTELFWVQELE